MRLCHLHCPDERELYSDLAEQIIPIVRMVMGQKQILSEQVFHFIRLPCPGFSAGRRDEDNGVIVQGRQVREDDCTFKRLSPISAEPFLI